MAGAFFRLPAALRLHIYTSHGRPNQISRHGAHVASKFSLRIDGSPSRWRRYATVVEERLWSEGTGKDESSVLGQVQVPKMPPKSGNSHQSKATATRHLKPSDEAQYTQTWAEVEEAVSSSLDAHIQSRPEEKATLMAQLLECEPDSLTEVRGLHLSLAQALNSENPVESVGDILRSRLAHRDDEAFLYTQEDLPLSPEPLNDDEAKKILESTCIEFIRTHKQLPTAEERHEQLGAKSKKVAMDPNRLTRLCKKYGASLKLKRIYKDNHELPDMYQNAQKGQFWACFTEIRIGDLFAAAVAGTGASKTNAKLAADWQILSKMHTTGALEKLVGAASKKASSVKKSQKSSAATPNQQETPVTESQPGAEKQELPDLKGGTSESLLSSLKQQYPSAPAGLWIHQTVPHILYQHAKEGFKQQGSLNAQPAGPISRVEYALQLDILGTSVAAKGEGRSGKIAKRDAWIKLLNQLHAKGVLQQLFSEPDHSKSETGEATKVDTTQETVPYTEVADEDMHFVDIDDHTLRNEKDAKLDIHNYAAGLGLVPEFSFSAIRPRSRRLKLAAKKRPLVEVRIKLPELGIDVSRTDLDRTKAEVAAAVAFKREAEVLGQTAAAQLPQTQAGVAKSPYVLSVDNAKDFMELYRQRSRYSNISIEFEATRSKGLRPPHKAQVFLNAVPLGKEAEMASKKAAEAVAFLNAALEVIKTEPEMLRTFAEALKKGKGRVLRSLPPLDVDIGTATMDIMRQALLSARRAGLPDVRETLTAEDADNATQPRSYNPKHLDSTLRDEASSDHLERLQRFEAEPSLNDKRAARASLPMMQHSSEVLMQISSSLYSIVIGATGSGKTTQVPQIILDDAIRHGQGGYCDVICTQPRRLAASSVAERVANERDEPLGQTVGYHVRGDNGKVPNPGGSITYCTTGILLEQLKRDPDGIMDSVSHLVIDEVHERDMQIDFLLIIVKKAIQARQQALKPVPKVILMSATLDAKLFSEYLGDESYDGQIVPCPTLSVPGRTFPVTEKYLGDFLPEIRSAHARDFDNLIDADDASRDYIAAEMGLVGSNASQSGVIDWKRERRQDTDDESPSSSREKEDALVPINLMGAAIAHISNTSANGAILAFLPGLAELTATKNLLLQGPIFGVDFADESKFKICLLHSTVPPGQQREVFDPVPDGCRKIILSTNIAETSVTVPDVKYVVDSGKLRENRYDQRRHITKLTCTWESNSNSKQRAGRAGRVQEGNYYALFSRERRQQFTASGLPELLRSDLQEVCLSIKAQRFEDSVSAFLSQAIEPPSRIAVTAAVEKLQATEAFTENEELTTLGRILSRLPVHPALGKIIILGIVFRCLDPIIILSAMDEGRPLFVSPIGQLKEVQRARKAYGHGDSDHLTDIAAFKTLRSVVDRSGWYAASDFGHANFLHMGAFKTFRTTAEQIEDILFEAGLIPSSSTMRSGLQYGGDEMNENSWNNELIKSLLLAGFHPNLAIKHTGTKSRVHRTATEDQAMVHPGAVHYTKEPRRGKDLYAFSTLAKGTDGKSTYMRNSSRVTPLMAILFGGKLQTRNWTRLTMDEWLPFRLRAFEPTFATQLTLEFRKALDRMLYGAFKSSSEVQRGQRFASSPMNDQFVKDVVELLKEDTARSGIWADSDGTKLDFSVADEVSALVGGDNWKRPQGQGR